MTPAPKPAFPTTPRRRARGGCLGCLPQLVGLVVLGLAVVIGVEWLTNPWIYSVGGRHRWLPLWQGVGEAQGPGGRYRVWIWFSPSNKSSHVLPSTSIDGSGVVCTPAGKKIDLHITGGASGVVYSNMDGHAFRVEGDHRPFLWTFTGAEPPRLAFSGRWVGDTLVMTDENSLAAAFLPNGEVNPKPAPWHAPEGGVPISFTERDWWWNPPCGGP